MINEVDNLIQDTQPTTQEAPQQQPEVDLNQAQQIDEAAQQAAAPEPEKPKEEGFQARNFRELKAIAMREKVEKERLARELEDIKRQLSQMPQAQERQAMPEASEYEDISLADDEIAEGKHIAKLNKNTRKAIENQRRLEAELEAIRIERKLEREIPDFYQVVTDDNVKAFALLDPALAEVIGSYPNIEKRAKAAYSAIVKAGIHKMADYDTQKELVKQNMSKPKPVTEVAQTGGTSAMSRSLDNYSGDLTDEMKRMYYQEMKRNQQGR